LSGELVPVFIPTLANLLFNLEKQKGSPLTESEVVAVRDKAVVIALSRAHADELTKRRGYADLDPENCWAEWLLLRHSLQDPL
jgi:hypothetical protein